MKTKRGFWIISALLTISQMPTTAWAQRIKGVVRDKDSNETLIGAVVTAVETGATNVNDKTGGVKTITDVDGNYTLDRLKKDKTYTLYIDYMGYKSKRIDGVKAKDANMDVALQTDEQQLKEVTVTAVQRLNTDAAMLEVAKSSPVIVSNVSA